MQRIPVVIQAPAPVITPSEARAARVFTEDDGDTYIAMLLAVAQSRIEGSYGLLGRAIGLQTLEITVCAGSRVDTARLPLPDYIDTVSDILSEDGRTRAFRWRAGYRTSADVPPEIKLAIILIAGALKDATPHEGGFVKKKSVEGVGSREYTVPDGAAASMQSAAAKLLEDFKVRRV